MGFKIGYIGRSRVRSVVGRFADMRIFGEDDQAIENFCFKLFAMLDDIGMCESDLFGIGVPLLDGLGLLENTLWMLLRTRRHYV
jgi:hypothetical protein